MHGVMRQCEMGMREGHEAKDFFLMPGVLTADARATSSSDFRITIELPRFRSWNPGQFVMLRWGSHVCGRPFAIVDWNQKTKNSGGASLLHLAVRDRGLGTHELVADLKKSHPVWVTAPLGVGFELKALESAERVLLLSEGGAACGLLSIAENRRIVCQQAALSRHHQDQWWHIEPEKLNLDKELMARSQAKPNQIFSGHSELLAQSERISEFCEIFAVGSFEFLEALVKGLDDFKGSVHVRLDENMGCGIGLCFSCAVFTSQGPQLSCRQGPWFDFARARAHLSNRASP